MAANDVGRDGLVPSIALICLGQCATSLVMVIVCHVFTMALGLFTESCQPVTVQGRRLTM